MIRTPPSRLSSVLRGACRASLERPLHRQGNVWVGWNARHCLLPSFSSRRFFFSRHALTRNSINFLAKGKRRVCATAIGVAPKCLKNRRRRWREPTPSRWAKTSTPPSSSPLSPIRRRARETVFEVPSRAGVPGERSGRQRRHGRKPASCGGGGTREIAAIFFFRCRGWADGTAVDHAADYSDEKLAVESGITRQPRS